jgi:hypothetical protein
MFDFAKGHIADATGLSRDALHVYVGLSVFLLTAIVAKCSMANWRPLAAVALASISGELWDVATLMTNGGPPSLDESWKDFWNTLFWPTILFALGRFTDTLGK